MKKLCIVATIPAVVHAFMRGHVRAASDRWPVTIVSHPESSELLSDMGAEFRPLDIQRKISPWQDLKAFVRLVMFFRRERFELVHSIMPKTGLLAMAAAWLTGVPNRMHTFTGQVWANKRGWKRVLLKRADQLIVFFATRVLVDSPSQRDFLVKEGVLPQSKGQVINNGSICGVDARRFHPDAAIRHAVREELGIGEQQTVILFLGRLNIDKGIPELAEAFAAMADRREDVVLLLVGAEEDVPFSRVQQLCGAHQGRLRRVSFTPTPERYMAASDIFCLPSHREGFGQVIIEAAACEVPTVATRIYGITDAVADGETGLLFPVGDVAMLTRHLLKLIEDVPLRRQMGEAARARALALFSSEKITSGMLDLYGELLERRQAAN